MEAAGKIFLALIQEFVQKVHLLWLNLFLAHSFVLKKLYFCTPQIKSAYKRLK